MNDTDLTIAQWIRIGAPVHAVALSGDGRYLLAGSERDLRLLDRWGYEWFRYSTPDRDLPFSLVALAPGATWGLAFERSGQLHRIDIIQQVETLQVSLRVIWNEPNDVCSLSLAADAGLIALGHYGPALTMLDGAGRQVWRRHPNDRTATDGQTWAVALAPSGDHLYVGCSSGARPRIAALDASDGKPVASVRFDHRVTWLASLPEPLAVAAVLNGDDTSQIAAYPPGLKLPQWTFEGAANERFTALTADMEANLIACGTNTGVVYVLDGSSGALLAAERALHSTVFSLSMAGGRYLIAGLQDGQVAYLEYLPQQEDMTI